MRSNRLPAHDRLGNNPAHAASPAARPVWREQPPRHERQYQGELNVKQKAADEYIPIDQRAMGAISRRIIGGRHPLETSSHLA